MKGTYNKGIAKNNANIDCVVRYNPKDDNIEDLTLRVLKHLFLYRLKYNKPVILGVFGRSGEGKSESMASVIEELTKVQGLEFSKYFEVMNVFTPLQYSDKLNKIMFDKQYKDIKMIIMHEAREVVKASNWHSFINVAISDVNAMARSIKRVMTVIISQGLMDISKGIRSTLTHYAKIERPNNPDLNAKMYLRVIYEDDTYMERPQLRRRKPKIMLIYPDGKSRVWIPNYFEIPRASVEVQNLLKEKDNEAKAPIIKKKLRQIQEEMEREWGTDKKSNMFSKMVDFYTQDREKFQQVLNFRRNKWQVNKEFIKMLGVEKKDQKQFTKELLLKAKEKGFFAKEDKNEKRD